MVKLAVEKWCSRLEQYWPKHPLKNWPWELNDSFWKNFENSHFSKLRQNYLFLSQLLIFELIIDCWVNYWFLSQLLIFEPIFQPIIDFFSQLLVFEPVIDFWANYGFWANYWFSVNYLCLSQLWIFQPIIGFWGNYWFCSLIY